MPVLSKGGRVVSSNSRTIFYDDNVIKIVLSASNGSVSNWTITIGTGPIWIDWGDGTVIKYTTNGVKSHTYTLAGTYTALIYGNNSSITYLFLQGTPIINIFNIKTGVLTYLLLTGNISNVLDLSKIQLNGTVNLVDNTNLPGILFSKLNNIITGSFYAYSCNLTGNLNLKNIYLPPDIRLYNNPNLTSIEVSNSNSINTIFRIYSCNLTGTLDLSNIVLTGAFRVDTNVNLTSLIFSSTTNYVNENTWVMTGCNFGYINFLNVNISSNNSTIWLQNNGMTAEEVNHILVDLDSISIAGFTGRLINIGGTNADPDGSSGGYDGVTARNNLISKGITVTIT